MKIKINGNHEEIEGKPNITELLVIKNVEMPDMVSVEHNGNILKRSDFEAVRLNENDSIEFLYFMGGGAIIR